ncbi:hypothetical protein C0Q70_19292 [Pomacea canaliculata]|uniref:Uncharacterized protein n=1 Tax=Pomacea canaliculata TaxID=400727 RepID=A0A2T7NIZ9_POMCA|nr:hypothetical protein C0Q70_19292 [Pomacea canaliculata]
MITHRRYLPTPPPTTTTLPSSDNSNNQDHHATATTEEVQMQALRLPLLPYFEQEQVEAVDLVVHKDNNNHHNHHHHHHPPHHHPQHHKWTGHVIHRCNGTMGSFEMMLA